MAGPGGEPRGVVILLSALAVVVAAALLVAWFIVGGGFGLIYAAMALAVVSMVLLWAARWIGSSPDPVLPDEPEPLPEREVGDHEVAAVADPVAVSAGRPEPRDEPVAAPAPAAGGDEAVPVFPIADYDTLWVAQILPLVAELEPDELAIVEARERGGRHRGAILDAIAGRRTTAPAPVEPVAEDDEGDDDLWADLAASARPEVEAAAVEVPASEVDDIGADPDPFDWTTLAVDGDEPPTDGLPAGDDGWPWGDEEPEAARPEPREGPHVRTFLGKRRSPVTVRRD